MLSNKKKYLNIHEVVNFFDVNAKSHIRSDIVKLKILFSYHELLKIAVDLDVIFIFLQKESIKITELESKGIK